MYFGTVSQFKGAAGGGVAGEGNHKIKSRGNEKKRVMFGLIKPFARRI